MARTGTPTLFYTFILYSFRPQLVRNSSHSYSLFASVKLSAGSRRHLFPEPGRPCTCSYVPTKGADPPVLPSSPSVSLSHLVSFRLLSCLSPSLHLPLLCSLRLPVSFLPFFASSRLFLLFSVSVSVCAVSVSVSFCLCFHQEKKTKNIWSAKEFDFYTTLTFSDCSCFFCHSDTDKIKLYWSHNGMLGTIEVVG